MITLNLVNVYVEIQLWPRGKQLFMSFVSWN